MAGGYLMDEIEEMLRIISRAVALSISIIILVYTFSSVFKLSSIETIQMVRSILEASLR